MESAENAMRFGRDNVDAAARALQARSRPPHWSAAGQTGRAQRPLPGVPLQAATSEAAALSPFKSCLDPLGGSGSGAGTDLVPADGGTQPGTVPAAEEAKEQGNALYRKGRFQAALRPYEKAIELDPTKACSSPPSCLVPAIPKHPRPSALAQRRPWSGGRCQPRAAPSRLSARPSLREPPRLPPARRRATGQTGLRRSSAWSAMRRRRRSASALLCSSPALRARTRRGQRTAAPAGGPLPRGYPASGGLCLSVSAPGPRPASAPRPAADVALASGSAPGVPLCAAGRAGRRVRGGECDVEGGPEQPDSLLAGVPRPASQSVAFSRAAPEQPRLAPLRQPHPALRPVLAAGSADGGGDGSTRNWPPRVPGPHQSSPLQSVAARLCAQARTAPQAKRFESAEAAYSQALAALTEMGAPAAPGAAVLLCNRALCRSNQARPGERGCDTRAARRSTLTPVFFRRRRETAPAACAGATQGSAAGRRRGSAAGPGLLQGCGKAACGSGGD